MMYQSDSAPYTDGFETDTTLEKPDDLTRPVSPVANGDIEKDASTEHPSSSEPTAHPRAGIATWKWIAILIGQFIAAFLFGLDTTIAATIQGSILEDLGHIELLPWVGVGFPLASVCGILLFSKAYDLFDLKIVLCASMFLFEIGSAICGAARYSTINTLIIGRVVAGLGGSGTYLGNLTLLSSMSTMKERGLFLASTGATYGIGAVLGPIVGGGFAVSSVGWDFAFFINLVLAVGIVPGFMLIPSIQPLPGVSFGKKWAQLDIVGGILFAGFIGLLVVALTLAGSNYAWSSATSIALWTASGVSLILFIVQQYFCILTSKADRLFPVNFLTRRELVVLFVVTGCASTAFGIPLYYVPLFFQFSRGDSAIEAAVRLLPFVILAIFSIMVAGATMPMTGRYAPYYPVGAVLIMIGGALMATLVNTTTSNANIYGYTILIGIGSGLTFQNGYAVAAAIVDKGRKEQGQAIGFMNTAQIGTIALSLSMAGCIFQNVGFNDLSSALSSYNFPPAEIRSGLGGSDSPLFANAAVRDITLGVIVATMGKLYWLVFAAGAVMLVSSPLLSYRKLKLDVGAA